MGTDICFPRMTPLMYQWVLGYEIALLFSAGPSQLETPSILSWLHVDQNFCCMSEGAVRRGSQLSWLGSPRIEFSQHRDSGDEKYQHLASLAAVGRESPHVIGHISPEQRAWSNFQETELRRNKEMQDSSNGTTSLFLDKIQQSFLNEYVSIFYMPLGQLPE